MCIPYVESTFRIVTQPTDTSAAAPFGAHFKFSIQVYGYLTINWYKYDKTPVPEKAYLTLISSVNETTSILTIPTVTSEDVGTYHCVVWANNMAVRSQRATLFLAGKICICDANVYVTRFTKTSRVATFCISRSGSLVVDCSHARFILEVEQSYR